MRKTLTPLPELGADNSAHAWTDCLASTELNPLGEPKRLYGETVARLEGWPYHRKKVTRLGQGLEGGVWISNHGLNFRTLTNHVPPFGVISRITWLGNELIKSINDSYRLFLNDPVIGLNQKVCWWNWCYSSFCLTTTKRQRLLSLARIVFKRTCVN